MLGCAAGETSKRGFVSEHGEGNCDGKGKRLPEKTIRYRYLQNTYRPQHLAKGYVI